MLSVFCNHQPHTRSKPIDGVIIVELGVSKLLSFKKRFVSIQALLRHNQYRKANYIKTVTLPAKKTLNVLCEKRLKSSMFKWTSFYNFLEFYCKILNSYAIYRCKKMIKILNCYLHAKKVMALCLRVQFFLANPVYSKCERKIKHDGIYGCHIEEDAPNRQNFLKLLTTRVRQITLG